MRIMKLLMH